MFKSLMRQVGFHHDNVVREERVSTVSSAEHVFVLSLVSLDVKAC